MQKCFLVAVNRSILSVTVSCHVLLASSKISSILLFLKISLNDKRRNVEIFLRNVLLHSWFLRRRYSDTTNKNHKCRRDTFPQLSIDQSFALRSKRYNCHKYTSATVNRSILPYSKTTSKNQTRGSARQRGNSLVSVLQFFKHVTTQRGKNEIFHKSMVPR